LQINITTVASSDLRESKLSVFPERVSGKEKFGAIVPKGNIVDGVNDMIPPGNELLEFLHFFYAALFTLKIQ
jgi:hypothetical protein